MVAQFSSSSSAFLFGPTAAGYQTEVPEQCTEYTESEHVSSNRGEPGAVYQQSTALRFPARHDANYDGMYFNLVTSPGILAVFTKVANTLQDIRSDRV